MLDYIVNDIFNKVPYEVKQYIQRLKNKFDYSTKAADVDQKNYIVIYYFSSYHYTSLIKQ